MRVPKYFLESQIASVLTYEALIPAIRQALIDYSRGSTGGPGSEVVQPQRSILRVNDRQGNPSGWFAAMPVIVGEFMAVKTVTFFPGNSELTGDAALPTHLAMIELLDRATGQPLAVMDGRLITEMRTAAVSAAAAQTLAPDAKTLGILGSGVQARSHIEALRVSHPAFREPGAIGVSGRNEAKVAELSVEMNVTAVPIEEAAACDIVLTVTAATQPVLLGKWLKSDSLVIGVGAVSPTSRELDDEVMASTLIVESRQSAQTESGDVLLSGAKVFAEIGEVMAGTAPLLPAGRIVFKSLGMGIEDLVGARLVWDALKNA